MFGDLQSQPGPEGERSRAAERLLREPGPIGAATEISETDRQEITLPYFASVMAWSGRVFGGPALALAPQEGGLLEGLAGRLPSPARPEPAAEELAPFGPKDDTGPAPRPSLADGREPAAPIALEMAAPMGEAARVKAPVEEAPRGEDVTAPSPPAPGTPPPVAATPAPAAAPQLGPQLEPLPAPEPEPEPEPEPKPEPQPEPEPEPKPEPVPLPEPQPEPGPVNAAPAGANAVIAIAEDGAHVFTPETFGFTDPDPGAALAAVRVDFAASLGTLLLDGAIVLEGALIGQADIAAGRLTYQPGLNAFGMFADVIGFTVQDEAGAFAAAPNTISFDIASVNDAPVATGPAAVTVGENQTAILTVAAIDADDDALRFYIAGGEDAALFIIDGQTGELSFHDAPDFEDPADSDQPNTYDVTIGIDDGTAATHARISIAVADANDAPTDILVTGGTIQEDVGSGGTIGAAFTSAGQVVATLGGVDPDADDTFTYEVIGGDSAKYEIVGDEIRVKAGVTLDFETDAADSVTVRVRDAAGATFDETIAITITDYEAAATGGASTDLIIGTSEEDIIEGGAGSDTLEGGAGADVITGSAGGSNLLVNGDFSDTAGVTRNAGFGVSATALPGWSINAGGVFEVHTTSNYSAFGGGAEQWLDMEASYEAITISQSIAGLSDGEALDLSFRVADRAPFRDNVMEVYWGGELVGTIANQTESFTTINLALVAGAGDGSNTLEFRGIAIGNDRIGIALGGIGLTRADADALSGGDGDDTLIAGAGADALAGGAGDDSLTGGDGHDVLTGGAGADMLDGGAGIDRASYADDTTGVTIDLAAGAGVSGHAEGDVLTGIEEVEGGSGDDALTGDALANALIGNDGDDVLQGLGGNDSLEGGAGDDILEGGEGRDYLEGGEGDDTLIGGLGDDRLEGGAGADFLDGGDGADGLRYLSDTVGVTIDLEASTATGAAGSHAEGDVISGFEHVQGGSGNDTLIGSSVANDLRGNDGDDFIQAGAGNDNVWGGAGADTLDGGAGADWLRYEDDFTGVTIDLSTNSASGGFAEGDVISGFEHVYGGEGDDVIIGSSANNSLRGGNGDDLIQAGDGNDTVYGGAGADTLDGGAGTGDWVRYDDDIDGVTVDLATNSASGGFAEGDVISGFENVFGGEGDDVIIGSSANNNLRGGAGDDLIQAGGGNDTVYGGAGADTLDGGGGVDWLRYDDDSTGVTIDLATNSASGGLAEGDVISGFENVFGGDEEDILTGSSANNDLRGGDGDDVIQASGGSDIVFGGAGADTLDGGDGVDTLRYDDDVTGVTVDLSTHSASGGIAEGDVISGFENVYGGAGGDVITGNAAANALRGLAGADTLHGGDGNDQLYGDSAAASAGGGDDILDGGAGNDLLVGGQGDDVLTGGAGNDTIHGGLVSGDLGTADRVVYSGAWADYAITHNAGTDTYTITDLRGGAPDGVDTVTGVELFEFADRTITVTSPSDLLNDAPTLIANTLTATNENGAGADITTITAVDPEGGALSFTVSDARFEVVADSGDDYILKLKDTIALDYESAAEIAVTVTVSDGVNVVDEIVTIEVGDVNEAPSAFTVFGAAGVALNTDGGNNAYLTTVNGGDVLGGATAFTVEVSFSSLQTDLADYVPLLSYAAPGNNNALLIGYSAAGQLSAQINGVGFSKGVAPETLFDGTPKTVSFAWSAETGTGTLYLDGIAIRSVTNVETINQPLLDGGTIVFGQEQDSVGGNFHPRQVFQGTFHDVKIYGDERSAAEIAASASDPQGAVTGDNALAHWKFSEFDGTSVRDLVGGNDLSAANVTGAGWIASTPTLVFSETAPPSIAENAAAGTVVAVLEGFDPDAGDTLNFSVDGPAADVALFNEWFEVVGNEIRVRAGAEVDYERFITALDGDPFELDLTVTDAAGLSHTTGLTIGIRDENEAPTGIIATVPQDGAVSLDHTDRFQSTASIDMVRDTFTIEFWVNPSKEIRLVPEATTNIWGTRGQSYVIWAAQADDATAMSGDSGLGVSVGVNGVQVFEHRGSHMPALLSYATTITGWTHVAVVVENGTPRLVLDGVDARTGLDSPSTSVFTSTKHIGDAGTNYGAFEGDIADVRLWDSAKSTADISAGMDTPVTGTEPGLVSALQFNGGTATDLVNPGYTVTPVGTPTASTIEVREGAIAGSVVAVLDSVDADAADTATFSLAAPSDQFEIVGNEVRVKAGAVFDHATDASHAIDVVVTDASGATHTETLTIAVVDINLNPTDMALSNASITENSAAGTVVGILSATDPNGGDSFSYKLINGDQEKYEIVGNEVHLKAGVELDFESDTQDGIRVRVTDSRGASFDKSFAIQIADVAEHLTVSGTFTDTGITELSVTGSAGTDVLTGGDGDDTITGGQGADVIDGGAGDDVLYAEGMTTAADPLVLFDGSQAAAGVSLSGAANDTIQFDAPIQAVTLVLGGGGSFQNVRITAYSGGVAVGMAGGEVYGDDAFVSIDLGEGVTFDELRIEAANEDPWSGFADFTPLGSSEYSVSGAYVMAVADAAGDTLQGGDGADTLYGGDGADQMHGGADDDVLAGGIGADLLDGGDGFDTADYSEAGHGLTLALDTFDARGFGFGLLGAENTGAGLGDNLISIERIVGTQFDDNIFGSAGGLTVQLGDGDDYFDTRVDQTGVDIIDGGAGEDRIFTGGGDDQIQGGAGRDSIKGEDGNDTIDGGADSDWIFGDAGDDTLTGGAGWDDLYGGDGSDTIIWRRGDHGDSVSGGAGVGWVDALEMDGSAGTLDYGTDWTVRLTSGTMTVDSGAQALILSGDADGVITVIATGDTIYFADLETIRWG